MTIYRFSAAILALMNGFILAVSPAVQAYGNKGAVGDIDNEIAFALRTEVGTIDNFLYSNEQARSTNFIALHPQLQFQTQSGRNLFAFDAQLDSFAFERFSEDNHTDFSFKPNYHYRFADNQSLYLQASLANSFRYRGRALTAGNAESIVAGDELQHYDAKLGYRFGRDQSMARLSLEFGLSNSSYQTRRAVTRQLDRQQAFINSRFDYLLSGKTYLAFDLGYQAITFVNNEIQDKAQYAALMGIKWASTQISELQLLLGYQQLNFSQAQFNDDDSFKWRLDYLWRPTEYTELQFVSERNFEAANRVADSYRVVDRYQVSAHYSLNDYISLTAKVANFSEQIIYQNAHESETYIATTLEVNYQRNARLYIFIQYEYQTLDSEASMIDYQRNSLSVGLSISI